MILQVSFRLGMAVGLMVCAGLGLAADQPSTVTPPAAASSVPLRVEIDQLVQDEAVGEPAPVVSDAEFLRRVSIDLIGMPPGLDELRAFVADTSPDKRATAVDRLMATPEFSRNLSAYLDVMLMERRKYENVSMEAWQSWLFQAIEQRRPYNEIVRDVLTTTGADPATRPAAHFFLDRDGEPNVITRDVGRVFLGVDLQCAQCHDHPLISDYRQSDYHGLLAFFAPSANVELTEEGKVNRYYLEKASSDVAFESVFIKGVRHLVGPQLPGEAEISEPFFAPGEEYQPTVAGQKGPAPKYSRRQKLAELLTSGQNRQFNETIANRLWGYMMGRGLVSPPDVRHAGNPPSNPALLKRLGERFAESGFDIAGFLKEVALSQTYQRAVDQPERVSVPAEQVVASLAEQTKTKESLQSRIESLRAGEEAALKEWNTAQLAVIPVLAERDAAVAKSREVVKKLEAAQKEQNDARTAVTTREGIIASVAEAATKGTEAAQKLPMDAELAAAAAKFTERLGTLKTELAALQKTAADKEAATVAVTAELTAANQAVAAVQERLTPLKDASRQKHDLWAAAKAEMDSTEGLSNRIDQKIARLQAMAELIAVQAKVAELDSQLASQQAQIDAMASQMGEREARLAASDTAYQQAIRQASAAQAAIETARNMLKSHEASIAAVSTALASSETALAAVPGEPGLKQAVETLKSRKGELDQAISAARQAVTEAVTSEQNLVAARTSAQQAFEQAFAEHQHGKAAQQQAREQIEALRQQVQESRNGLEQSLGDVATQWTSENLVASLKPLTPEQMCTTVFQVTGIYESYRSVEVADFAKNAPLSEADQKDPARVRAREREIEQRVFDKLVKSHRGLYTNLYAAAAGAPQDEFFASADQALFTANADPIFRWSASGVAGKMVAEPDMNKAAAMLYETVLSRLPSAEEVVEVEKYLAGRPADQKTAAAQELVWSLISSVEFRLNH